MSPRLRALAPPLLSLVVGGVLFFGGLLAQWLGIAALLYGLVALFKMGICHTSPKLRAWLLPASFVSSLVLLLGITYRALLRGQMPWVADHAVHQSKAWILWNRLLPTGRIAGWTHFAGAGGYPAEVLYPPFVDLYLVALRALTLGTLSWEATYALGLFGFLLFYVLVFYYVGNRLGGPATGLFTALFSFMDRGAFREGGWVFAVRWGVWPLSLSVAFSLLTLIWFWDYLRRERSPKWALTTGGFALLTHPMSLLWLFPTVLLTVLFVPIDTQKDLPARLAQRATLLSRGLFSLLGILLFASWWLLPFFTYGSSFSAHVSALSGTLDNVAQGLLTASSWHSAWSLPALLGGLGLVTIWRTREHPLLMAMSLTALGALVVGSSTFLSGLSLFTLLPTLRHVQFPRFLLFVKATFYLGAGWYLTRFIKETRPQLPNRFLLSLITLLVVAALLAPGLHYLWNHRISPLSSFPTTPPLKRGLEEAAEVLLKDSKTLKGNFKVALTGHFGEHRHTGFPQLVNRPFVKLTYVPSDTYLYRAKRYKWQLATSPKELQLQNIAYLLSINPKPFPRTKLLYGKYGVYLYRYLDYNPNPITTTQGTIRLLTFEDERVEFAVAGLPPEGGWVQVPISPFPPWRASQGGEELALHVVKPTANLTYLNLHVKNGVVTLRYQRRWPTYLGGTLSLLLLGFLLVPGRLLYPLPKRYGRRLRSWCVYRLRGLLALPLPRWVRLAKVGLLLLLAPLLLFTLYRAGESPHTLLLRNATVTISQGAHTTKCLWFYPQRFLCKEKTGYVGLEARSVNDEIQTGIFLHPEGGVVYRVTWENPDSTTLDLTAAIDDTAHPKNGLPVELLVRQGEHQLGVVHLTRKSLQLQRSFPLRKEGALTLTIRAKGKGQTNLLLVPKIE